MTSSPRARRRPGWFDAKRRPQTVAGLVMVAPFLVAFLVFQLGPIVSSMAMSFTDMTSRDLRSPFAVDFVGLDNVETLFTDPRFVRSLVNTGVFVLVATPLTIACALVLAVALNNGIKRFKGLFRTALYVPVVTSTVAVAVVWKSLFADEGIVNSVLSVAGIDGPNYLQDSFWAMPVVILLAVWRMTGLVMVLFLAGLQGIPAPLYEAATVDGAGTWRKFISITVPMLMPILLLAGVILSVAFVQVFEEPFVLTQGGPLDATSTASLYVYDLFGFGKYGVASAASYVLFVAIAILALIQFRIFRRRT
ncbi:multiple sugar transport system permease protein [Nonomuraea solani]|uniref:Multiple sugar transport system permease protein n=1 Tax=Nonomuraea solani TaxID=1144553 RepID=A0A1H6EWH1_9ACTN|nr:sugar ABC transporter permease [Nonomuraea solani]SEH02197.1 multiple sugar transport system permease protein [Nonomuraea solani]